MGQLMGIVGPLLLLGGAIFVVSKRCELLGLCGDVGGGDDVAGAVTDDSGVTSGGVDESASNRDENGNWAGGNKSCCVCEMQGDRVKCQKHGGAWYNPPAMNGVSNDQSVELSLEACNATCGSNSTSPTDREKSEIKGVKCPSGYTSVNGKCQKSSSIPTRGGTGKATGSNSRAPKPASPARRPSTGNLGEKGTKYVQQPVKAKGSASYLNRGKGYKPGGGTYYTYRSYFVDPYYVRPFTLYHRIAN